MSGLQKALFLLSKHGKFAIREIDIPSPGPGELLVKVEAAALNPVDWKIHTNGIIVNEYPAILGTDGAGTVEEVGEGVAGFAKGDRILSQGMFVNPHAMFQQYTLTNAKVTAKIPSNISFDEAATIPVCLGTAALALFNRYDEAGSAGLYPPWEEGGRGKYSGKPIVIFGGASSTGQFAIQLAKLAGFSPVITTASLHNTDLLTSLGATHVLDRRLSPPVLHAAITDITSEPLGIVFDAVSLPDTQNTAFDVLAPHGCLVLVLFDKIDSEKKRANPGKKVVKPFGNVNLAPNAETGESLYAQLTSLLEERHFKPNPVEVLPDGLLGIPAGLERMKNDQVSGTKLVAHPQYRA